MVTVLDNAQKEQPHKTDIAQESVNPTRITGIMDAIAIAQLI